MKKITAEFIGTYFLMLFGCGAIVINQTVRGIITHAGTAITAAFALKFLFPSNEYSGATIPMRSNSQSLILELLLTFLLMFVIIKVAHGSKETGMFAGIAIGGVVTLEAMFAFGASINPARSLVSAIVSGHVQHLWIYIAAPVLGAGLCILLYTYLKTHSLTTKTVHL